MKDINTYLGGFRIPDTFPEPITMKHLMSHTPGFEDRVLGLFTKDESELKPLAGVIKEQKLKRIWPPGRIYYTCMALISSSFLWLLYYWEFLIPG
jgi:CubicO group peptidase (beta-lactamase class C family)